MNEAILSGSLYFSLNAEFKLIHINVNSIQFISYFRSRVVSLQHEIFDSSKFNVSKIHNAIMCKHVFKTGRLINRIISKNVNPPL